jgi:uncharacterized protein (TIGR03435 family)
VTATVDPAVATRFDSATLLSAILRQVLATRFLLRAHVEPRVLDTYALKMARSDGRVGGHLTHSTLNCTALEAQRGPTPDASTSRVPTRPPQSDEKYYCGLIRFSYTTDGVVLNPRGIQMSQLAQAVQPYVERMVVDKTGLSGLFDVELTFRPDVLPGAPPGSLAGADSPSIYAAIQEQLGLKLESERGPIDCLVIDHAELPSPN